VVASRRGGLVGSTGALVRRRAAVEGLTVEEMSAHLTHAPEEDIRLDYLAAAEISRGAVSVFESRLSGHIGSLLRSLGRAGLCSVYLTCAPRERALRCVAREISPFARARLELFLPTRPERGFAEWLVALAVLDGGAAPTIADRLRTVVERDERDRRRLWRLYGLDIADRSAFDHVLDCSHKSPADLADEILEIAWPSSSGQQGLKGRDLGRGENEIGAFSCWETATGRLAGGGRRNAPRTTLVKELKLAYKQGPMAVSDLIHQLSPAASEGTNSSGISGNQGPTAGYGDIPSLGTSGCPWRACSTRARKPG
jgi:cytidylate kinase